ncbi:MAG: tetratricopeptide repeat protein [Microcoleaceae cyanobacterium]
MTNGLLQDTAAINQAEQYFQVARQLEQEGQLQDSAKSYQLAIKAAPGEARYYQELGDVLVQTARFNEAEAAYQQAVRFRPNWFKPFHSLGILSDRQGQAAQAADYYQQSIDLNPRFSWSYFNLGNLKAQAGDLEAATQLYQKAIEVHPPEKSYWFQLKLAEVWMKQGKPNLAIPAYTTATQLKPNLPGAYIGLGDALYQVGQLENATAQYKKALALKPNDAVAYQRLQECRVSTSLATSPELQEYHELLAKGSAEPQEYLKVGQKLTKMGLVETAVTAYLRALEVQPTFSPVYESLKNASLHLRSLDEVVMTYRQIIQKYPDFLLAHVNLADALTQQGQVKAALSSYQKAACLKAQAKSPEFIQNGWDDSQPRQPHFIIIGAEKCGTSSLYQYISQHPQVLEPVKKEIHFFTQQFDKGLAWYEAHFLPISKKSGYITGEASTSYIGCHNDAPQRLFNLYPNVKLLAILRDPVERAVSHYNQLVRLGREGRPLEEVMMAEMEVLEGVNNIWSVRHQYWNVGKGCIWHGLYICFLEQWMSVFPKEQFWILRSEDLFEQPGETMDGVFEFLEISGIQLANYQKYNSGGQYKGIESILNRKMVNFFQSFTERLDDLLRAEANISRS